MGQFDKKSAERIGRVVGYVESVIRNQPARRGAGPVFPPYGFWARITDSDGAGKYSWQMQTINADGTLSDDDDGRSGSHEDDAGYAVSASGDHHVENDSVVWMVPALSQDFLVFGGSAGGSSMSVKEGVLHTALAANGSAVMDCWDCSFTPDGTQVTVKDRAGHSGAAGKYCLAIKICGEWRVDIVGC